MCVASGVASGVGELGAFCVECFGMSLVVEAIFVSQNLAAVRLDKVARETTVDRMLGGGGEFVEQLVHVFVANCGVVRRLLARGGAIFQHVIFVRVQDCTRARPRLEN